MKLLAASLSQNRSFFTHPKRLVFFLISLTVMFSFMAIEMKDVFATAGINETINFQGKVTNTDGTNVADGSYDFVFRLYKVSSSGTAQWTETWNSGTSQVTVSNGIFRVALGTHASISSLDFNDDSWYLSVEFNGDGEMDPRIRFASVPYALNAKKVSGLTVTNTTGTFTLANSKTFVVNNGLTFSGTDSTTFTFPVGSGTVVTLDSSGTLTNKTIGSTGLIFSGATTDITTGTDEALTITPNGTGDIVLSGDADTNLQLTFSAAPGIDMAAFSNSGQATTTDGVDGLQITYAVGNIGSSANNAGLRIDVTSSATSTQDVLGVNIGDLSGAHASVTETGIRIGTGWDRGLVIESGGSTNSGLVYSGDGRPTKTITLSPEYPGSTLTASGSATTNGSMTADASGSAQLNRTYYEWISTEAILQDYTALVRVKLPADFDSWTTGTTMTVSYNTGSSVTATNALDVYIYNSSDDSTGRPVYFSTNNVSAKTWTTLDLTSFNLDDGSSPDWDSAGETVAIYFKMRSSGTHNYVQIGDIVINYLAKF